ncbi:MAG: flagellar motor switch protein [Roseinatronobacter sp.]
MALVIDMIILLLLAGTLIYAFLVDRRVRALMAALRGLEPMVGEFSAAVDRSENSVRSLRAEAGSRGASSRSDEPQLTRNTTPLSKTRVSQGDAAPRPTVQSMRAAEAKESALPPGIARVNGKSELVRGFFETVRSRGA